MDNRKPTSKTQRITRKGTSAPRRVRKSPLAEEAAAEIAASSPPAATAAVETPPAEPAPPPAVAMPAPPPVIIIEPRKVAGDDEPTTRVIFRARTIEGMRPSGWLLVRSIIVRLRSELQQRSAPVRAGLARRFPRLAGPIAGIARAFVRLGW